MTNWAHSTVATAPSPPTTGTSLTVASGEGARFPVASFLLTVFPADAEPTSSNAELVFCTSRTGDVLTITRQSEGTAARTIGVGDRCYAGLTQGMWDARADDHEALADPHTMYAQEKGTYTAAWVRNMSFNAAGVHQFAHGQGVAPIAFIASGEMGTSRVTVHPGASDATNLNFKAFNGDATADYYEGTLSQVHVIGVFPSSRPT